MDSNSTNIESIKFKMDTIDIKCGLTNARRINKRIQEEPIHGHIRIRRQESCIHKESPSQATSAVTTTKK